MLPEHFDHGDPVGVAGALAERPLAERCDVPLAGGPGGDRVLAQDLDQGRAAARLRLLVRGAVRERAVLARLDAASRAVPTRAITPPPSRTMSYATISVSSYRSLGGMSGSSLWNCESYARWSSSRYPVAISVGLSDAEEVNESTMRAENLIVERVHLTARDERQSHQFRDETTGLGSPVARF